MKRTFIVLSAAMMVMASCSRTESAYVDPETGQALTLVKDENSGLLVDADTKKPVYIYVDTKKKDTILGATGEVINGHVVLVDGKYKYDDYKVKREDGEYKIKSGDYKKEVEKDGDITIKDGDKKIKIDGETGEKKVKRD